MLRCINMLEVPDSARSASAARRSACASAAAAWSPADRAQVDRIRSAVAMVFQSFNLWST
jgi:ABC-type histidine transport system ATPase subunit